MKHIYLLFLCCYCYLTNINAANLIVRQDGYLGVYPGIQTAIDAANNNDSIIVYERYYGLSWHENLTITKNLNIVSGIDSLRVRIDGSITIQPAPGISFNFLGQYKQHVVKYKLCKK